MDPDEFRRAAEHAARIAADHVDCLPLRPVYQPVPADVAQHLLGLDLPDDGMSSDEVLRLFAEEVMPYDMGNQHPTFAAWVNPAAAPIARSRVPTRSRRERASARAPDARRP
jgi:hypothetical protein